MFPFPHNIQHPPLGHNTDMVALLATNMPYTPTPGLHKLGLVVHTCNPSPWENEQKDCMYQASMAYTMRPCSLKPS